MKRLAWIFAAAAVCVVALFLLAGLLLPRDALKARLGEQIAAWTGRDVSLRGEPQVGLFPLRVTLNDVQVAGPEGMDDAAILSMDRLTGTIRLLPLIIGRIEIDSFTMVRPLIRLVRDEKGHRNWDFDSGVAALQLAFAGDVPLGEFRLEGGTVVYEDREDGAEERLDSVNLSIDWTSVRKPIAIDGSGIWRGEEVSFTGSANAPFAYLNGSKTPVVARIEAPPLSMSLSGEASGYPHMRLAGALKLATPSLRRFASWLGSPIGPGSTLGTASLSGTASLNDNVLSVADAKLVLDGNAATGALEIVAGATPDITGTLAFETLDLSAYFAGVSAALSLGPDWRKVALPTDWFSSMTADVRLSADTVKLGGFAAGDTAASVTLRDSRFEIGVARATFEEGSVSGDLALTDMAGTLDAGVEAQLRATDVSLARAGPLLGLPDSVSGTASVVVDVTTEGRDLGALVGALGGTAELRVNDGALPLFGLPAIASAPDGVSDVAAADPTPEPVQSAVVGLSFADGVGTVTRANLVTASYSADADGWIGLLNGRLGLNGTLHPGAPGTTGDVPAPFTIEGTLGHPVAQRQAAAN